MTPRCGARFASAARSDEGGRRTTAADDNLKKIDHVVVLMMENRSFEHMLGFPTIDAAGKAVF
ncbi:MAG TPA: alkaline phosphatase family protein [Gaiellaceae bacterium]|nr:alkaline phosphatase family protein [Gaiellaceae bacterium]